MTEMGETAANVTTSIIDQHIAATRGDRTALRYGDKRYSYHDVAALMNRAGNMLRGLSIGPEENVLLLLDPSPALVASVLGAMKIGATPVVVSGAITEEIIRAAAEESDPKVIIAHEKYLHLVDAAISTDGDQTEVVVVGQETHERTSFVELIQAAASSLTRVQTPSEATALAIFDGSALQAVSHGDLRP